MAKLSGVADVKNTIRGTSEADIITGSNLADRLYGGAEADVITGGAGNDYINAGEGYNRIDGGAGDDTIYGGSGLDYYTVGSGEGNDTIIDKINGKYNILYANFLTTETSGVFIKRGNDLIIAEGTVNLTGDADGDGNDAEDLATELAGIQGLASVAARRAGMRSILKNLTNSVTVKHHFSSEDGIAEYLYAGNSNDVTSQIIAAGLVDYSTGLKYFNQSVTNADIVRGTKTQDHIIASKSGQILKGGKGDDVYFIDSVTDVIIEDSSGASDQVVFGDNNGGADVYTFTREGNNLRIDYDDGSGGDVDASAIIKNHFLKNGAQIEKVASDADGDLSAGVVDYILGFDFPGWRVADKMAAFTSNTNILKGTQAGDKLDLAAAGQTAYGYAGADEYTVTAGKAVIFDNAGYDYLNADHLATQNDGVYIKKGNDLIILDGTDAVTGYADADTAVADLTNLSAFQRRTVVKDLLAMSDSITIKNYFTTAGFMESIYALNNSTINEIVIMPELINYNTGLKFYNQDANTRRIIGTAVNDYIVATRDGQKIFGKGNGDRYIIPGGITDVEIYDSFNAINNSIQFSQADLDGADSIGFEKIGNDLKLIVTDAGDGDSSAIIKNYYINNEYSAPIISIVRDWDAGHTLYPKINESGNFQGGESNDLLRCTYGDDTINGGSARFNDNLYGYEGSDVYEFLSGDQNDKIYEVDATADDTDKAVILGADFSLASSSITLTRNGDDLDVLVDEGDGTTTGFTVDSYYAGGSSQIEVIEDGQGNSFDLTTGLTSANFNAELVGSDEGETLSASNNGMAIRGNGGADVLIGLSGNDTIDGGAGIDIINDFGGDDSITGGAGNDLIGGGFGNDTIDGGLGDDTIDVGNPAGGDNDVVLYDLDSGTAAGADTVTDLTIGEDVVRFTTSANDTLGFDFRNHIAVRDTGAGLEIGYGWDEAAQDYANTITFTAYDDASVSTANVIEFVTADGTTALTAAEITAILADIAADGDAPGTLAAIHDDIDAGAGGNDGQLLVDSINAAW